jgi:anti-sigma regulatory factor (Ser/Thr protein kinase)
VTRPRVLRRRRLPRDAEQLALLVSELVTNAIRHANATPGCGIGLRVDLNDGCIRVEVSDWGHVFDPRAQPDFDDIGGWRLYLADSLSDRSGLLRAEPKVVWVSSTARDARRALH